MNKTDEELNLAEAMAKRYGVRMCDENGDTNGEELYCVGIDDIADIIREALADHIAASGKMIAEQEKQEPVGENKAVRCFLMGYGANRGLTVGAMRKHMELCGYGEWPEMIKFEPETNHLTKAVAQFWIRFLFKRYDTYAAPVSAKREWVELTVSDLDAIIEKHYDDEMDLKAMILDGIAAFKEKNK